MDRICRHKARGRGRPKWRGEGKYADYFSTQVLLADCVDRATFYSLTMGKATETVTPAALSVEDDITHMQSTKPPKSENSAAMAKPHPDFWYPGASVILEVENIKFKLHRPILQRHSAYFSSLFQKEAAYLEVEKGIPNVTTPVYRVSETTADDFATLLALTGKPMCVSALLLPT